MWTTHKSLIALSDMRRAMEVAFTAVPIVAAGGLVEPIVPVAVTCAWAYNEHVLQQESFEWKCQHTTPASAAAARITWEIIVVSCGRSAIIEVHAERIHTLLL